MSVILLPILASSGDSTNPPGLAFANSRPYLTFDSSTDELCVWTFRLPDNYSSSPVLNIHWSGSSSTTTANTVYWRAEVMKITPDSGGASDSDGYATVNTATDTILGTTAKRLQVATLALTNFDSAAAGDYIAIRFGRDADNAGGSHLGEDAWLWDLSLTYTAS